VKLHSVEWGEKDAPPLVCLHGVTSHALRFRRLGERLADRFRVVSLDLRGHGTSEWEPPWDLDTHVGDLLETADSLGIVAADWMGHSFGGRLGLELAARSPERVGRLVLLDPAVWVPPPRALQIAEETRADESFTSPEEAVERRIASGSAPFAPRALIEEDIKAHIRRDGDGRWRFPFSRAAVVAEYGEMAKVPPLERVTAPTLVVRGSESEVLPPQLVETMRELHAGPLEVADVRSGHVVMWDALEATGDTVERFLSAGPDGR
jgi:lipase